MNPRQTAPITCGDGVAAVAEFLQRMGSYCAAGDFDSTESLFAPDVASFGTRASVVEGLGPLRARQWEGIWPNIEDFRMLMDELRAGADGDLAWGMVPWTSTGFDEQGQAFERPGRATVVLQRRDGCWLAIHSHFSLSPGTPQRTFGHKTTGGG